MSINKQEVLTKLNDYLCKRISKNDVYEWANKIVMSKDFDRLEKTDKLLSDAIQVLWELHHEGGKFDPTQEELEYFQRCLEDKEKYRL